MSELEEWQREIVFREQWINLAGSEAAEAIALGAGGADILQALTGTPANRILTNTADRTSDALGRVARAASAAVQHGASPEYVKSRVVVLLAQSGLSHEQASKLAGRDRAGFQRLCAEMSDAQREALRLTVDPKTFEEQYR